MDVTGIVALVLAAGGAAYLIRARIISSREAGSLTKGAARDSATLPPTLRPTDEKGTKKKTGAASKATAPATPQAKAEADAATSKRTVLAEVAPAAKDKEEPAPTKPAEKPAEAKKPEPEPVKNAPAKAEAPKPVVVDEPASRTAVTKPPAADSKPPTATPPIEVKLAPLVESNPKITPAPVTMPEKKFNKKATIVGIAPVARGSAPSPQAVPRPETPKSPPPKSPPPKIDLPPKKDAVPVVDVPRLDTDEDEELEPTRVGRYERQSIRPPIERHVFDAGADGEKKDGAPLQLIVYALAQSDPGKRRKQNEDSYLVRDKDSVYVVADGMGGHRGGEFASKIAVETIDGAFEKKVFEAEAHVDLPTAASELARAIQMANAAILGEAARRPELKGMGTTLCAARFTEENRRLFIGHVGDSRCYRVRDGMMKQMTTDHTMADYGVTGPEGAHLSRALGVWPTVPIDVIMAAPELGDVYLLCSDGLTKMLPEQTIQTQLLHEEDPKTAVQRLIFFANSHGGKDNITVILLRVVDADWKPPSERATSA